MAAAGCSQVQKPLDVTRAVTAVTAKGIQEGPAGEDPLTGLSVGLQLGSVITRIAAAGGGKLCEALRAHARLGSPGVGRPGTPGRGAMSGEGLPVVRAGAAMDLDEPSVNICDCVMARPAGYSDVLPRRGNPQEQARSGVALLPAQ